MTERTERSRAVDVLGYRVALATARPADLLGGLMMIGGALCLVLGLSGLWLVFMGGLVVAMGVSAWWRPRVFRAVRARVADLPEEAVVLLVHRLEQLPPGEQTLTSLEALLADDQEDCGTLGHHYPGCPHQLLA